MHVPAPPHACVQAVAAGSHVSEQLPVPVHVMEQPSVQVEMQFPVFEQSMSHPPPAQSNTQFEMPLQTRRQPPPGQS